MTHHGCLIFSHQKLVKWFLLLQFLKLITWPLFLETILVRVKKIAKDHQEIRNDENVNVIFLKLRLILHLIKVQTSIAWFNVIFGFAWVWKDTGPIVDWDATQFGSGCRPNQLLRSNTNIATSLPLWAIYKWCWRKKTVTRIKEGEPRELFFYARTASQKKKKKFMSFFVKFDQHHIDRYCYFSRQLYPSIEHSLNRSWQLLKQNFEFKI